ncbi:T9SS type A sorting domain-containing protein [Saccharicrinis sp. 156]|uniref:T9SS type A sorting domain-containing protein n=1 Tax=Saccharicrinis sp. 156 TaxID=3417574 RepID=UPI003D33C8CB
MRQLLLLIVLLLYGLAKGQTNITGYTYWLDDDMEQAITGTASEPTFIFTETLDGSSLTDGMHFFNYRCKDDSGRWSSVLSHAFYKLPALPQAENHTITGYQYWLNNRAVTTINSVPASDMLVFSDVFNLDTLSYGMHSLSFRSIDNHGRWSPVMTHFFYRMKAEKPLAPQNINYSEYWIDDYEKQMANISSSTPTFSLSEVLNLDTLAKGMHSFNARFRSDSSLWSSIHTHFFYKLDTPEPITPSHLTTFEYWFDDEIVNKQTQAIGPAQSHIFLSNFDLSNIENGMHAFNCCYKDDHGKYSSVMSHLFYKLPTEKAPYEDNVITAYRVVFDNDPNLVQEFSIPDNTSNPFVLDASISCPFSTLGEHDISFQFKDKYDMWSSVCSNRDNIPTFTGSNTSTSNFVKIYPNPFKKELFIDYDLDQHSRLHLEVYNIMGKLIHKEYLDYTVGHHHLSFDSTYSSGEDIARGIYIIRVYTADKKINKTFKVIKL